MNAINYTAEQVALIKSIIDFAKATTYASNVPVKAMKELKETSIELEKHVVRERTEYGHRVEELTVCPGFCWIYKAGYSGDLHEVASGLIIDGNVGDTARVPEQYLQFIR